MISVIIPTLNEAATIAAVVASVRRAEEVNEVIVVDDGSIDGTAARARTAGATVFTSTMLGKGVSMQDGLRAARNEIVLYLDGDLAGLRDGLVRRMTGPIREGTADFVKARFARRAGRVTALTARPLLRTFFPELAHFEQPLGGIIAGRRSLLRRLRFENDYGVDIGLLLDAAMTGAALAEVDIGPIEHDSHPLEALRDMAEQVARAVLDRAARHGRLHAAQLQDATERASQTPADLSALPRRLGPGQCLALLDMDGVVVKGRFIVHLARRTKREAQLAAFLDHPELPAAERASRIAAVFAGVPRQVFEETARDLPLTADAAETVIGLRSAGYQVGLVTDSYQVAAEIVRRRVFADFCVAHQLQFRHGRATGELTLAPAMRHRHGCPRHDHCKVNVLHHLLERTNLRTEHVLAIGDGDNDVCLLKSAGQSVAFQPKSALVQAAARHLMHGPLSNVLAVLRESPTARPTRRSKPFPNDRTYRNALAEKKS